MDALRKLLRRQHRARRERCGAGAEIGAERQGTARRRLERRPQILRQLHRAARQPIDERERRIAVPDAGGRQRIRRDQKIAGVG